MSSYRMVDAREIAKRLGITEKHAYKIIRSLNAELEVEGYCIVRGRVDESYFAKRYFPGEEEDGNARI